jgi:hypothetical protein
VAGAQRGLGAGRARGRRGGFRRALEHEPGEVGPVLVVAVDHQGGEGVLAQVRKAFQLGAGLTLWFLVGGEVVGRAVPPLLAVRGKGFPRSYDPPNKSLTVRG